MVGWCGQVLIGALGNFPPRWGARSAALPRHPLPPKYSGRPSTPNAPRGCMVILLRPCMRSSTYLQSSTPPPPPPFLSPLLLLCMTMSTLSLSLLNSISELRWTVFRLWMKSTLIEAEVRAVWKNQPRSVPLVPLHLGVRSRHPHSSARPRNPPEKRQNASPLLGGTPAAGIGAIYSPLCRGKIGGNQTLGRISEG